MDSLSALDSPIELEGENAERYWEIEAILFKYLYGRRDTVSICLSVYVAAVLLVILSSLGFIVREQFRGCSAISCFDPFLRMSIMLGLPEWRFGIAVVLGVFLVTFLAAPLAKHFIAWDIRRRRKKSAAKLSALAQQPEYREVMNLMRRAEMRWQRRSSDDTTSVLGEAVRSAFKNP